MNLVLKIRKVSETGEWRVEWWENGRYDEEKTYYTDDYEDALLTAKAEAGAARLEGYVVEVRN